MVDVETGTLRFAMTGHTRTVTSASFSMDGGSKLASSSHDGTCKEVPSWQGVGLVDRNVSI